MIVDAINRTIAVYTALWVINIAQRATLTS